jgi:hypothetical protein
MKAIGLRDVVMVAGALALALGPALAGERPRTSSVVKAPVQGGGGVQPVEGAPPPVEPSLETKPVRATLAPGPRQAQADLARASLRAVSLAEGAATLEIDGVRQVVRPGERIGGDTVRSVAPGRIVLERKGTPTQGSALVLVTFDESGRGRTRVFWTADPTSAPQAEVKRP